MPIRRPATAPCILLSSQLSRSENPQNTAEGAAAAAAARDSSPLRRSSSRDALPTDHAALLRRQLDINREALQRAAAVAVARLRLQQFYLPSAADDATAAAAAAHGTSQTAGAVAAAGGAVGGRIQLPEAAAAMVDMLSTVGPPTLLRGADGTPAIVGSAAIGAWMQAWKVGLEGLWRETKQDGAAAEARAAPWVASIRDALRSVIDPNAASLREHLLGMRAEQLAAAAVEMRGPSSVYKVIAAALDDVERQFLQVWGLTVV